MSFLKFLISKVFYKHLAIAFGALALILTATFIGLNIYTHHGEAYEVPDFSGLTEDQFRDLILQKEFRYNIIDSVHIDDFLPGAVVEQIPQAGAKVKRNRTIHFTINALMPEQVQVPDLVDYSLRNAKVILESYGLIAGELIYVPSEYTNLVLGQHYEGKAITPGTSIQKGSVIDLLIGQGLSQKKTNIPDLTGLSIDEAKYFCQSASLNIGASMYDESVQTAEDSLFAFIWKQHPMPKEGSRLRLGSSIDIWLSVDSSRIMPDTLSIDMPVADSVQAVIPAETNNIAITE